MLTLSRGSRRAGSSDPLPTVHSALAEAGIRPRFGQVTMIAALPNSGKSMFALDLAVEWVKEHGLWGLYVSADTDEGEMRRRALAKITGETLDEVEEGLEGPGEAWYMDHLDSLKDLRWTFRSDPDMNFIMGELDAFHEAYGAHPDFIVVDNLMNLVGDAPPNDKSGLQELQMGLKFLARSYGMGVIVLHHASEFAGDPAKPPARKFIQSKVNELPEQIITIAYDMEQGRFGVAGVKLRGAKADPSADRPVWLSADFSRCHFGPIAISTPAAVTEFWKELDD